MADIRIDRYEEDLSGSSGTITITDVGNVNSAFVRIMGSSRQDSAGPIGNTGNLGPDHLGIRLELTGTTEITYTQQSSGDTLKVMFEVWVYTGSPGGAYEFISRQRGTASLSGSSVTAAVSGLTDRNDCVPIFTGWTSATTSNSDWEQATVACYLNSSSQVEFSRTNSGTTVVCAYDVVEFTGSAWNVGCGVSSNHATGNTAFSGGEVVTLNTDSSGSGGSTFDVTDWATAMIIQGTMGGDSIETGLSDTLMYFLPGPSTTQLRCTLDNTGSRNDADAYGYVIQCADLVVSRTSTTAFSEGNNSYGSNLAAPSGYSYSTPLSEVALEWFPGTNGEGTAHARGAIHAQIIDTGSVYQVQHWVHRSGNTCKAAYAFADFSALVDTPPPSGTGFQAKRWDGAVHNNVVVKGWSGSSWVEAKFWDGVAWIGGGGAPVQHPGGFIENPSGAVARAPVSDFSFLPAGTGEFDFPAPWNTRGVRLFDAETFGANALPVEYSYWRVSNNHVGSDIMKIMVRLPEANGGPSIIEYNKVTGAVGAPQPIFDTGVLYRIPTAFQGVYFSATDPNKLYWAYEGAFMSIDVSSLPLQLADVNTVFDASRTGAGNKVWQANSDHNDQYHSMTYRDSGYAFLGAVVYDEVTDTFQTFPANGTFDECQIDRGGNWLLVKEQVDGLQGEDNRVFDLTGGLAAAPATEKVLFDPDGAGGHSDNGFGFMVAADNYANNSNQKRLWDFSQDPLAGSSTTVYFNSNWFSAAANHISWCHAVPASTTPIANQYVVGSGLTDNTHIHTNDIFAIPLDGSQDCLIIAPNMSADSGAGGSFYDRLPKGNTDITGEYFIWSSNRGGSAYMDIFMVKIPKHLLGNAPP